MRVRKPWDIPPGSQGCSGAGRQYARKRPRRGSGAKLLLAFDMLAGRLELYPMLALFAPRLWRKRINAMHEARAK